MIPVKVHIKGQEKSVFTYAVLDNFASDCFLSEKLMEQLGIRGISTEINLTTMEVAGKTVSTRAVGLEITDLNGIKKIDLPVAFSREVLPVDRNDLVSEEEIRSWAHLADIPFEFIDTDVGLMLGANAIEAIKPLKIITGQEGKPYAARHKLGWSVNEPMRSSRNVKDVKINRIKADYKDIENELREVFDAGFEDSSLDGFSPSVEDRKWQTKVDKTTYRDEEGHYVIPLPFKEENSFLPNNKLKQLDTSKW